MELSCKVQNYDWGKLGAASLVAQLASCDNFTIDENLPYAELWMGTHVNAPSVVKCTGSPLLDVIQNQPECVGTAVLDKFGTDLPFLFKVLSVRKALSIQAHPGKALAEELHKKFPDVYKDPNHKPELAIALTPFEALCGFRPINEIRKNVQNIPELGRIVGETILKTPDDETFVREAFKAVLTCSPTQLQDETTSLINRLKQLCKPERDSLQADLIEKLNSQFPNDVGLFVVYFLNYIEMQPSEAIFLGANKPHAYLSGDCIECMACSDNVVRAGFTPKFIDVETLISMLIYKGEQPSEILFQPVVEDECTKVYRPPVPDFAVAQIKLGQDVGSYKSIPRNSASIFIVISGTGKVENIDLSAGKILFLQAQQSLEIFVQQDLVIYQAFANL